MTIPSIEEFVLPVMRMANGSDTYCAVASTARASVGSTLVIIFDRILQDLLV